MAGETSGEASVDINMTAVARTKPQLKTQLRAVGVTTACSCAVRMIPAIYAYYCSDSNPM